MINEREDKKERSVTQGIKMIKIPNNDRCGYEKILQHLKKWHNKTGKKRSDADNWTRKMRETRKREKGKRIEWKEEKSVLKHWYGVLESSFIQMNQHLYALRKNGKMQQNDCVFDKKLFKWKTKKNLTCACVATKRVNWIEISPVVLAMSKGTLGQLT